MNPRWRERTRLDVTDIFAAYPPVALYEALFFIWIGIGAWLHVPCVLAA